MLSTSIDDSDQCEMHLIMAYFILIIIVIRVCINSPIIPTMVLIAAVSTIVMFQDLNQKSRNLGKKKKTQKSRNRKVVKLKKH